VPRESRLFVKTSLVAIVVAFGAGGTMAIMKALGWGFPDVWATEHAHIAFVGWLVNLVIGIAWWMLPLNRERFPSTAGRYPPNAPYLVWWLLNAGLCLRVVSEPYLAIGIVPRAALVVASCAQALAIVVFAVTIWARVRGPSQPAKGVR
jgi:hypothetical protein